MSKVSKRLFDVSMLLFGFLLIVALMNVDHFTTGTTRVIAFSVIGWLMTSLPLGVLIGHCVLSRED